MVKFTPVIQNHLRSVNPNPNKRFDPLLPTYQRLVLTKLEMISYWVVMDLIAKSLAAPGKCRVLKKPDKLIMAKRYDTSSADRACDSIRYQVKMFEPLLMMIGQLMLSGHGVLI
ncbi:hypothetical protein PoB_002064200 [Plakobranchus ocellatus]|uniref:Uncharacterized protein n=1 Tax=Plakobranchus ocellatus TaxID=259542 RepID=A0AAV3ZI00_9GAST|nr:hypothetical protein PoB_002064200 [Plakobranchus ocellatus]